MLLGSHLERTNNMKLFFILLSLVIIHTASVADVYAVACNPPQTGNYTISADCAFSGTINGVDSGTGTTNTAQLHISSGILTINASQIIAVGTLILEGGSVALPINNTGAIKTRAAVYLVDADADGYPATTIQYAGGSPPADGRRRNVMTSLTLTDCYDQSAQAFPGQTLFFSAHRGDTSFDYNCDLATTKGYDICTCACGNDCLATPVCNFTQGAWAAACGTSVASGPVSCSRTAGVYGECTSCTGNGSVNTLMECR